MSADRQDDASPVEGHDGILVVRGGEFCRDWNGIHYKTGFPRRTSAHGTVG